MEYVDYLYRAFKDYKNELKSVRENKDFKGVVNSNKQKDDFLELVRFECIIEDDWIKEIEKGIEYIEKAINEDRQFIRNEGDVLPIERVRRISKDSIVDLGKHSEYISKIPEDDAESVIPEKLLMIQKESDYSIYENRVLYATLLYLKDFVELRLEKIKEAMNQYNGNCQIIKDVDMGSRSIAFSMNLKEVRKNDSIVVAMNKESENIKRIESCLNNITILLRTPLMVEVSKTPVVKRPITKTNVLRMNINFRESLALFDYVCDYTKDGYNIKENKVRIEPLDENIENDFSELVMLGSFIAFLHNTGCTKQLEERYLQEERKRKLKLQEELLEKVAKLREKAANSEQGLNDYLLTLDETFNSLKEEMENLRNDIVKINEQHDQEIVELKNQFNEEKQGIFDEFSREKAEIIGNFESKVSELNQTISDKEAIISEKEKELAEKQELIDLANTEILALRISNKDKDISFTDFTSKERFDQLEKELNVLEKFFKKSWNETKKNIRKEHLTINKNKDGGSGDENKE